MGRLLFGLIAVFFKRSECPQCSAAHSRSQAILQVTNDLLQQAASCNTGAPSFSSQKNNCLLTLTLSLKGKPNLRGLPLLSYPPVQSRIPACTRQLSSLQHLFLLTCRFNSLIHHFFLSALLGNTVTDADTPPVWPPNRQTALVPLALLRAFPNKVEDTTAVGFALWTTLSFQQKKSSETTLVDTFHA